MKDILGKASQIKLVIFDVDGVLTDGSLFLGDDGQEYKAFHSQDGHGIKMLQKHGVRCAIITGRTSKVVEHRMRNLGIDLIYQGQEKYEKAAEVKEVIDLILNQTHKTSLLSEPVNSANVLFEVSGQFDKDYILLISGKIYLRKINSKNITHFDDAVDDFYNGTINYDFIPTDEDLEKIKITLNWLIKNRNSLRTFYLNNYSGKAELYSNISSFSSSNTSFHETSFDIKDLANV